MAEEEGGGEGEEELDRDAAQILHVLATRYGGPVRGDSVLKNYLQRLQSWIGEEAVEDATTSEQQLHASLKDKINKLMLAFQRGALHASQVPLRSLAILFLQTITLKFGRASPVAALEKQLLTTQNELQTVQQQLQLLSEKQPEPVETKEKEEEGERLEENFATRMGFVELRRQLADKNKSILQQSAVLMRGGLDAGVGRALEDEQQQFLDKVNSVIATAAAGASRSSSSDTGEYWPDLNDSEVSASLRDETLELLQSYRMARYLDAKHVESTGLPIGFGVLFGAFWQRFAFPFHSIFLEEGQPGLLQELTGAVNPTLPASPAQNPAVSHFLADGLLIDDVREPFPGPHYGDLSMDQDKLTAELGPLTELERRRSLRRLVLLRKSEKKAHYGDALWPGHSLLVDRGGSVNTLVQKQAPTSELFDVPPPSTQLTSGVTELIRHLRQAHLEPGLERLDRATLGEEKAAAGGKNMSIRVLLLAVLDAVLQIETTGYAFSGSIPLSQPRLLAQIQAQDVSHRLRTLLLVSPWKAHSFCGGNSAVTEAGRMTLTAMQELQDLALVSRQVTMSLISPALLYPQNYFAATYLRAWIESFTNQPLLADSDFYSALFRLDANGERHPLSTRYPYAITALLGYHDTAFSMETAVLPVDLHSVGPPALSGEWAATTYGAGPDGNRVFDVEADDLTVSTEVQQSVFLVVATSPYALGTSAPSEETTARSQAEVANAAGTLLLQQHQSGAFMKMKTTGLGSKVTSSSSGSAEVTASAASPASSSPPVSLQPIEAEAEAEAVVVVSSHTKESVISDTERLMAETDLLLQQYDDSLEEGEGEEGTQDDDEDMGSGGVQADDFDEDDLFAEIDRWTEREETK